MEDAAQQFEILVVGARDGARLELFGELDGFAAPRLRARITEIIAEGPQTVVVDLRNLDFMDSQGLAELIGDRRMTEAAGIAFRLRRGNARIQLLLERSGALREFTFAS